MKYERVRKAYSEKWENLKNALNAAKIGSDLSMIINAYKTEGKLEIWLKSKADQTYTLFRTYDFCAHSGTIGPKVVYGDRQTPEGFYYINIFNPTSNFYLSLGINYPNSVDYARTGKNRKTGNDIFIHGNCVTVGCIPLTDDKIKEVYILAVEARNAGQKKIPVNIYPFKMSEENMKEYLPSFPAQASFWKTLQQAYMVFDKNKNPPKITEAHGKS